ncbi:hypothetical protein RJ639_009730 [Escallonia herrerae]|uniref:Transposase (putative) gypsy type domain-containing protein n=1 Tax=Escallonia herrerae TaxID=1293975 RepID=A0AA88VNS3_9ASTE|nr:hypothetical protein RJ639_009730 [Escallonia herrerae]
MAVEMAQASLMETRAWAAAWGRQRHGSTNGVGQSTQWRRRRVAPSTSQPSHSLPAKNALGDVKDQAEDKANPKPWYTTDEKSSKMSTEDLLELIREYPLPEGWYARLPSLQEPANYGTRFETGIYKEQVKSGYRLPLHPFALHFFEHYHMAPGKLVPNGWRKLTGLIYLVQTSGYKPDVTDFMRVLLEIYFVKGVANCPRWYYIHRGLSIDEPLSEQQLEWTMIIPHKPVPTGALIPPPPATSAESVPLGVLCIVKRVSIDEDPVFRLRWTLKCDDIGMPDNQISKQHLLHGVLPRDKEVFQNQTLETFACFFAQAVYMMYASRFEILSHFEMARQVAAEEAQQKRDAVREAEEAPHCTQELSKQEADYLARIETLERRLEWVKRKAAEDVKKLETKAFTISLTEMQGKSG